VALLVAFAVLTFGGPLDALEVVLAVGENAVAERFVFFLVLVMEPEELELSPVLTAFLGCCFSSSMLLLGGASAFCCC